MSQETEDALEAAIKAHYSDETGGGMLTEWSIAMYGVGMDMEKPAEYLFGHSATPIHSLRGLADMNAEYQKDRIYEEDDDE